MMSRKWWYEQNRKTKPASEKEQPYIVAIMFIAFVVIVLIMGGCTPAASAPAPAATGQALSADTFTDAWPFTVDSGVLRCNAGAITFESGGVTYAVNGTAMGRIDANGWVDVDAIWADNPDGLTPKINMAPVISAGSALCG